MPGAPWRRRAQRFVGTLEGKPFCSIVAAGGKRKSAAEPQCELQAEDRSALTRHRRFFSPKERLATASSFGIPLSVRVVVAFFGSAHPLCVR